VSGITLSASVRQNLLSLQSTASLLATTQNDLATGNKVNSALDNPTSYFTAQGLNNRASDISNLLDQIGNGVQVLQAANTGITSLQSLVSSAQSIANQVLQAPTGYSTKSSVSSTAISGATADDLLGTQTYTSGTFTNTSLTNGSGGAVTISTPLTGPASSRLGTLLTTSDDVVVNGKTISFNSGAGTTLVNGRFDRP
jgi:flagellin